VATNDHKRWCTSNASGKGKGGCGKGNNDVMVRVYPAMARVVQPRVEDDDDNNDDDSSKSKGMGTTMGSKGSKSKGPKGKRKGSKGSKYKGKGNFSKGSKSKHKDKGSPVATPRCATMGDDNNIVMASSSVRARAVLARVMKMMMASGIRQRMLWQGQW